MTELRFLFSIGEMISPVAVKSTVLKREDVSSSIGLVSILNMAWAVRQSAFSILAVEDEEITREMRNGGYNDTNGKRR
ncbi:hypothetical protein [Haladaptatus sp. NG-SE-30]